MNQRRSESQQSTHVDLQPLLFSFHGTMYTRDAVIQMISTGTIPSEDLQRAVQFLVTTATNAPPTVQYTPNQPTTSQVARNEPPTAYNINPQLSQSMPIAYVAPTPQSILINPNPIGYIINSPPQYEMVNQATGIWTPQNAASAGQWRPISRQRPRQILNLRDPPRGSATQPIRQAILMRSTTETPTQVTTELQTHRETARAELHQNLETRTQARMNLQTPDFTRSMPPLAGPSNANQPRTIEQRQVARRLSDSALRDSPPEVTHEGHRIPMYSYPDMEFLELCTPTSVTPVTYYICTAYAMYSIGIAIVPQDYLTPRYTPNPYDEWPLLLQFGSHLDISGTNWEPAPTPTVGTYIRVRSYFPIDYPRNRRPPTATADPQPELPANNLPRPGGVASDFIITTHTGMQSLSTTKEFGIVINSFVRNVNQERLRCIITSRRTPNGIYISTRRISPRFATTPPAGTLIHATIVIVERDQRDVLHYRNTYIVPREHFHYRNALPFAPGIALATLVSISPLNQDEQIFTLRIAEQWPRAQQVYHFQLTWFMHQQIATALFNTERVRAYRGFTRATVTCTIAQLRPHHQFIININADTSVSRGVIRDIALQMQPGRYFALTQVNENGAPQSLFYIRITEVGYHEDTNVPTAIYAERDIEYGPLDQALPEANFANSWTNPQASPFWNGLNRTPEPFRRAVTPDSYIERLPPTIQHPAEPNAPNISDEHLFRNRGCQLEAPIQLWPIYDRTEHQGRNQLLNEWNPGVILEAPEPMAQTIAYILCGIMLPRALEQTIMPPIRNGFTHLEEFPQGLRNQEADDNQNQQPHQVQIDELFGPQIDERSFSVNSSRSRSRSPVDELNPVRLQEEQLLVNPKEVIHQHEWQFKFERDYIRPEWNMIPNDQYRPAYIAFFTQIIGNVIQAFPTELPPTAALTELVRTATEGYRTIHRAEWPQGQRYRNYRNFNEYQTREFILGRIAGWLLATNTVPQGRQPDINIFRPNEREVDLMQRNSTLDAYTNTVRTVHHLFTTVNHRWLNFVADQEQNSLIMADNIAYTRSVAYVRIWIQMASRVIATLMHHQGIQTITPQQIHNRAYDEANQMAANTPQQFEQIFQQGHQAVITFYDAINYLFYLFNELTNQEENLEHPGTHRTILYQMYLEPTSSLNDHQRKSPNKSSPPCET